VKKKEIVSFAPRSRKFILAFSIQVFIAASVCAQTAPGPESQPATQPTTQPTTPPAQPQTSPVVTSPAPAAADTAALAAAAEAEAVQKRVERARALAAAHQLGAAATELESLRASARDNVVRNNCSLMLMGIYLEDGNYGRAEAMLEESFKQRSANNEASVRTYFALAGQAVNGARAHLARYRMFGINVSGAGLPAEAATDLDRLRSLLERLSAQGKDLISENAKANDAFALLEDISGIRATLARDASDRSRWESEYAAARARLATLPTDVATNSGGPGAGQSTPSETPSLNAHTSAPPTVGDPGATERSVTSQDTKGTPAASPKTSAESVNVRKDANGVAIMELGSLLERATKKVQPVYPQTARNLGTSGLVRVKVVVDETGSVANIVWAEGPMMLRQAAQDALKQWKFQPVMVDGKPARVTGYVDFGFAR
jgi:TonB family protein